MTRVRVKICGVTRAADVAAAVAAGADAVGVNCYPKSPRYLDPLRAGELLRAVPPLVDAVGVFAVQPVRQVCALAFQLGLRVVQYHAETQVPEDAAPFAFVPAFRVRSAADLALVDAYLAACREQNRPVAAVLVDGHAPGLLGGTGVTAPWDVLAQWRPGVPLVLAGGLTPDNVADAVRRVRPFAVDVAGGVESAPGVKDPIKVRDFVAAATG